MPHWKSHMENDAEYNEIVYNDAFEFRDDAAADYWDQIADADNQHAVNDALMHIDIHMFSPSLMEMPETRSKMR